MVIGVETEYAVAPRNITDSDTFEPDYDTLDTVHNFRAETLISRLRAKYPNLSGHRGGIFLGNSARVYDDRGHVEYCTPEASCPLEATAHLLAGRRLLYDALAKNPCLESPQVLSALFDLNLDYNPKQCSGWGCHENYSFRGPSPGIRRAILPHLC